MSFKDKPLKKINADHRVTIDVLHNGLLNDFNTTKEEIIEIKKDLLEGENNETKIYSDVKEIIRKDKNIKNVVSFHSFRARARAFEMKGDGYEFT